jgi:hypothetical protein
MKSLYLNHSKNTDEGRVYYRLNKNVSAGFHAQVKQRKKQFP